jgi:sterol desaturase/sphingolipid hydroxylase (fatty acid hydroxylase superfamily)
MAEYYIHLIHLLSIPIYGFLVPLEILLSHFKGWKFYTWKQTTLNVYLNILNTLIDVALRGVALGALVIAHGFAIKNTLPFAPYWILLFLMEDFIFWLEHFVDHHVRLFWAVHVTHHSSEEFNLSTGFRSSVLMPFYRYLYFIPIALLGFDPIDIFFMYALTQLYGILVHTQSIKKLPRWIEAVMVTPSHHRVHHASNPLYLDKNLGMVLIIWDRLAGTFQEELPEEQVVYGLTKPLSNPNHPVKIVVHEWQEIASDMRRKVTLPVKLRYLFKPPGWSHDGSRKTSEELRQEWRRRVGDLYR